MARNKYPEETEQKILDVAFRLFQEKGYDCTTIQDIVDGLGMSKGAVYHHFKSKEDILDRLYDRTYGNTRFIEDLPTSMTGLEKLREIFHRQFTDPEKLDVDAIQISYLKNPQLLQRLLISSVQRGGPVAQQLLEEGISDGSVTTQYPKELAESLLLLCNLWVGVFSSDKEDFMSKICYLKAMTDALGAPIIDEALMAELNHYFDCLFDKFDHLN